MSAAVSMAGEGASAGGGVAVTNPSGAGKWVLVCEHAGNFIPPRLRDLGLAPELLTSHIAWDPGALAVARRLSELLDAPLVAQLTSRLIYDCNRPPESDGAMPAVSEVHRIPGNEDLADSARRARIEGIYLPFRDAVAACIDRQAARGDVAVVTVHSFTPVYKGRRRDVEIGILHDSDSRLADAVLAAAAGDGPVVRRNEPYGPQDGVTHTLKIHALPRGLANVMIEVRNDLIGDSASQEAMAQRLSRWLLAARGG